jgi:chemotaxis signal transduction protein
MNESTEGLLFRVGPELFASRLATVEEAIDLDTTEEVAGSRASLIGVIRHRGALVPVYDPTEVLNVESRHLTTALVVKVSDELVALAVDDVLDAVVLDPRQLRQITGSVVADRVFKGVVRLDDTLVGVLDLHALVAACRGLSDSESQ